MITQHFVLNCLQANCCPWPWMVDTGTDGPVTLTTWVNNLIHGPELDFTWFSRLRYSIEQPHSHTFSTWVDNLRHGPELDKSQTDTHCLLCSVDSRRFRGVETVLENGPPIGWYTFSSDLICQRMPPVQYRHFPHEQTQGTLLSSLTLSLTSPVSQYILAGCLGEFQGIKQNALNHLKLPQMVKANLMVLDSQNKILGEPEVSCVIICKINVFAYLPMM